MTCHQITASLFELDQRTYEHQAYEDWMVGVKRGAREEKRRLPYYVPPCALFHYTFMNYERYSMADVGRYWAAGKIFGGVVLFDRGKSDTEGWVEPPVRADMLSDSANPGGSRELS